MTRASSIAFSDWARTPPLTLLLSLAALGCHRGEQESAPAQPAPTAAGSSAPVPTRTGTASLWPALSGCRNPTGSRDVTIEWSKVTASGGCFFFSGPGNLGRDTQLGTHGRWEESGQAVALVIGAARFTGEAGKTPVRLQRSARHDYSGPWRITETIVGTWREPAPLVQTISQGRCPELDASYAYGECNESNPAECPGRCIISAHLRVRNLETP